MLPVTVLTGFLGTGKTTLLSHVLSQRSAERFAVVQNEFGSWKADANVMSAQASCVIPVLDGCACCVTQSALHTAFAHLAQRAGDFDHVVIEVSGLAHPGPILAAIDTVGGALTLNGVVTVVDARSALWDDGTGDTWRDQVRLADLIVLNKSSEVVPAQRHAVMHDLQALNPLARVVATDRGRVPAERVLELPGRLLDRPAPITHHHDGSVSAVTLACSGHLDGNRLDAWLGALVRSESHAVLYVKGVVALHGFANRYLLHAMAQHIEVAAGPPWGATPRQTRLLIIGRGLDAAKLQTELAACHPTLATGEDHALHL